MSRESARYDYTLGSTRESAIVYDDDSKIHNHSDTNPARGQHNAFDLVRLHRFGKLDEGVSSDTPVTRRPSYVAMVAFVNSLPEIRANRAKENLVDLGPLPAAPSNDDWLATGERPRFSPVPPNEFTGGPKQDWLIRGVLPRAGVAIIYGESGSGKSFLALDLGAAITRGIEWHGRRTAKGRVAYVCAEGAGGFRKRLRAYAQGHDCEVKELPWVIPDAPNMLDKEDAAAITKALTEWGKVDVVVVDTLSAVAPGGNENSGESMGLVLSHCRQLHRATGALVVLIHHSGKDKARGSRGWSGLKADADAEIEVTRAGDNRAWATSKMRDDKDDIRGGFKLKVIPLGLDDDGEPESSCVVEHTEQPEKATPAGKQRPSLGRQTIVYDLLKMMAPSGTADYEDLREAYKTKVPRSGDAKKDNRKADAKRAITDLISKKLAFMHGEDRVSLTSLVTSDGPSFDKPTKGD